MNTNIMFLICMLPDHFTINSIKSDILSTINGKIFHPKNMHDICKQKSKIS